MIGARIRNIDWDAATSGALHFVGDRALPGLLHGHVVRSPHGHARVSGIDVSAAKSVPGVVAVLTADDLPDIQYPHMGPKFADRGVLAGDRVRFVGEPVALVVAESPSAARLGGQAVRVRYRPLRVVSTLDDAQRPGAPALHERTLGKNIAAHLIREFGDLVPSETPGAVQISGNFRFNRQTHVCMEPSIAIAHWHQDTQRLELWTTTQSPFFVEQEVAVVLGLQQEQVVIRETAVGGGFGARSKVCEHEALAGALSMATGRPVRLALSREEEFGTTKCRHDFDIDLTTRATGDGRFLSHTATMRVDNGAYNHSGPSVVDAGIADLASLYDTPGVRVDALLLDTNKHPGGQFRGYGGLQATFALESQVDQLSTQLGIDPIELRIRNSHVSNTTTIAGWKLTTAYPRECLERLRAAWNWDAKRQRGGQGRGVGVALAVHQTGIRSYPEANQSQATVELDEDGGIEVRFGSADPGTGQRTIVAQFAATELGVPLDRIHVTMMDSEKTPQDLGSWSSRGTFMAGHAVQSAAREAADKIRERAADKFGVAPHSIELKDGNAVAGSDSIPIRELVRTDGPLTVTSDFVVDTDMVNRETGVANLSPSYSFAAQAVEVEVDRRTGRIRVLDVISVHDSGTIVNPVNAEGQVAGGVVMALGAALSEELIYEHGKLVNDSYLNYGIPRSADMPNISMEFLGEGDGVGPAGAKSLGEIPMMGIPAAVANAVEHAVGVRITELPLTPDKVLAALRQAEGRKPRKFAVWRRPGRWWIASMRKLYPLGLHWFLHRWGTRLSRRTVAPVEPPELVRPASVAEASEQLKNPDAKAIGGGTDLVPARAQGVRPSTVFVDLRGLTEMRGIVEDDEGFWVGATTTLAELQKSEAATAWPALAQTIATIATAPIREMATLAGNLVQEKRCWFFRSGFDCYKRGGVTCPCYAVEGDSRYYHAVVDGHRCQAVTPSDLATTLGAIDARIEVSDAGGRRRLLPVEEFYTGPGEACLKPGDLVTRVRIPMPGTGREAVFEKLQLWEGDFAIVSAAAALTLNEQGLVEDARIVLGSVGLTPWRARDAERALMGHRLDVERIGIAAEAWTHHAHPLDRNLWKVDAAVGVLTTCLERFTGEG